jgi:hypothetical protein
MKKKALALVFVLVFLFSEAFLFQFVGLAKANPVYSSTPTEPNKDPSVLTVQSPGNATYWNINEVLLKLTVTQPDSWNESSKIKEVRYQLDGELTVLWDGNHGTHHGAPSVNYSLPQTSQFSAVLRGLCKGQHTLQVTVCAESNYFPHLPDYKFPSIYAMNVSKTVIFTIDADDAIPEFPSWVILPLFTIAPLAVIFCGKRFRAHLKRY